MREQTFTSVYKRKTTLPGSDIKYAITEFPAGGLCSAHMSSLGFLQYKSPHA